MKYEVVIVGAGPAGSTAAKFLSEKGMKVLLIDKDKFPRDKPCGGGIPCRVFDRFPYAKDKNLIESYSYGGFAFSSSLKHRAAIKNSNPIVAMVVRKKFDMGLVEKAIDAGADFVDGKAVTDVKISDEISKVVLDDKSEIDSEIIVGADGVWSTVAKKSGLITGKKQLGMCVFKEYDLGEEAINELFGKEKMCYIHLKFQDLQGYGWVFPKKQHVNIGIGRISPRIDLPENRKNLLKIYKKYIDTLKKTKVIPEDLRIERCKGGALPVVPLDKTYGNRVLLCGDSGGLINPLSGEGIYYAMSTAEIAAGVIIEAIESGDTSEQFLSRYQTNWKNDFGRDIKILLRLSKNWGSGNEKLVEFASRDSKLAELTLGILNGRLSISQYKWKIIKSYLYNSFKDRLHLT
jgi:geranylgeranyl reductase family protein